MNLNLVEITLKYIGIYPDLYIFLYDGKNNVLKVV